MSGFRRCVAFITVFILMLNSFSAALAEFRFPAALEQIEEEAFDGDLSLKGLVMLPEKLNTIGNHAFRGSNLFALRVPASVRTFNGLGLAGSQKIAYVYLEGASSQITSTQGAHYIFGPSNSVMKSNPAFVSFDSLIESNGFYYTNTNGAATLLCAVNDTAVPASVVIPSKVDGIPVTAVGPDAFWQLEQVTSITLDESVSTDATSFSGAPNAVITRIDASTPVITSLTPDKAEPFTKGDTVTWTASAMGGTEPYKYQFEIYLGTTSLQKTSYAASASFSYTFTEAGTYHIEARLRDDDFNTNTLTSEEFTVLGAGANITVTSLTPSVTSAMLGDTVTWTAAADKGVGTYRYAFELKDEAGARAAYRGYDAQSTFDTTFTAPGVYSMTVSVLDEESNSASLTWEGFEVSLYPLEIASVTASEETLITDKEITWTAAAQGGLAPYTYSFTLEDANESNDTGLFTHTFETAGSYTLHVTVTDANALTVSTDLALTVSLRPLEVTSITHSPETVQTEDEMIWTVSAAGGTEPYSYAYILYLDGEEIDSMGYQSEPTFTCTPENPGAYSLEVIVRDSAKKTARLTSDPVSVTKKPLTAVGIELAEPAIPVNTAASIRGIAQGGQKPLRYAFEIYQNNELVHSTSYSLSDSITYTPTAAGEYTIKMMVKDADDTPAEITGQTKLTVYDLMVLNGVSVSASAASTGETVTWTADITGGMLPLAYDWSIRLDGEEVFVFYGSDQNFIDYAPLSSGSYTALLTVRDASGAEAEAEGASVTVSDAAGTTDESAFTFSNGTITGYSGTDAVVIVPETIGGVTVTSIGANAFKNNQTISSVVLPETVTSIGNNAFQSCTVLLSVSMPGVKSVNKYAFSSCYALRLIDFTKSLTSIGQYAFEWCMCLTDLRFPDVTGDEALDYGLKTIDVGAFENCTYLQTVHLSDTVTTIHARAFQKCTHLHDINYPLSLKTTSDVDYGAFRGCVSLKSVTIPEGVTVLAAALFTNAEALEQVTLPSTLKKIDDNPALGKGAFQGCVSLTTINLPYGLTYIGKN
ncbi:MAG: leucine-rich repeat protein, partial [Clostridia bacterium]|nr:leucine-rich repeat protein [Clostridia bacterium]